MSDNRYYPSVTTGASGARYPSDHPGRKKTYYFKQEDGKIHVTEDFVKWTPTNERSVWAARQSLMGGGS